jgi:hypothetical protein
MIEPLRSQDPRIHTSGHSHILRCIKCPEVELLHPVTSGLLTARYRDSTAEQQLESSTKLRRLELSGVSMPNAKSR